MRTSASRAPAPAPEPICVNCGSTLVAEFCAGCGQRTPTAADYSMRAFLRAALGHVTNYDGRLLSTARKLFLRPGQLARDHFEGRRAQHLDPFRIFVLANLVAWLIVPHTKMLGFSVKSAIRFAMLLPWWLKLTAVRAALAHVPVEEMLRRIDAISSAENSVAVLCLAPILSAGLWLVVRGYRYVQHLVFAAHFYCIHLLCALLYLGFILQPLARWAKVHAPSMLPVLANNWCQHMVAAPALMLYLYFGLQRAYLLSPRQSGWRAIVLGLWACTVSRMFFDIGFALCLIWA